MGGISQVASVLGMADLVDVGSNHTVQQEVASQPRVLIYLLAAVAQNQVAIQP